MGPTATSAEGCEPGTKTTAERNPNGVEPRGRRRSGRHRWSGPESGRTCRAAGNHPLRPRRDDRHETRSRRHPRSANRPGSGSRARTRLGRVPFNRKTLATAAPPVPNQALRSPWTTRHVPLAANAPSPGKAGGMTLAMTRFHDLPPSSVARIKNRPSIGSPCARPLALCPVSDRVDKALGVVVLKRPGPGSRRHQLTGRFARVPPRQ